MGRFWVLGPIETMEGDEQWSVVDGLDLPGQRRAAKPHGYSEFWNTKLAAEEHAEFMNLRCEALEGSPKPKPGEPGFQWPRCAICGSRSLRCGCD